MKRPRRVGTYAVSHSGTVEDYERVDADRITIILKTGYELRVSITKDQEAIEIYTTDGRIKILPNVSNVITVGVEDS